LRAARCQHHVGGFEIAMNDARAMGGIERVGDLDTEGQGLLQRQGASLQPCRERLAFEGFNDEKLHAPVDSNLEERAAVRMIEACYGRGFTVEARSTIRIAGDVLTKNLNGDDAIDARVSGFVDLAHPACAEQMDDFVRAESRSRRERHRLPLNSADSATK